MGFNGNTSSPRTTEQQNGARLRPTCAVELTIEEWHALLQKDAEIRPELLSRISKQLDSEIEKKEIAEALGMVYSIATKVGRRISRRADLDDLIGAGSMELIRSWRRWDSTRGLKRSTYCMWRIRGGMLDEMRSWTWGPQKKRECKKVIPQMLSLDEPISSEQDFSNDFQGHLEDKRANLIADIDAMNDFQTLINNLSPLQQIVMWDQYVYDRDAAETSRIHGIKKSMVFRHRYAAMKKIRHQIAGGY